MLIVKTPEEEALDAIEGAYGFFLGDVGKFLFKAVPAAIGGFLVTGGSPIGAAIGAATGFIGGDPKKVLKRFLYGVGAAGLVSGVTGLVAPQYQSYLHGPLSSKISGILSKIKTKIPGMTGGEIQFTAPGVKEGMGLAEKLKTMYKLPEMTMAEKMKSVVLPSISSQISAGGGIGTAGIGAKLISASKELIKTGLETLAKGMIVSQIPNIVGAQMQYPTAPFQVYQMPEGPIIYEPTTDTMVVPKPVAEKAQKDVQKEIQARQKPPVVPQKPPVVTKKPSVTTAEMLFKKEYLPYWIVFIIGLGFVLAERR